ncbi:MAG TPA: alginate export family protein [Usitatibacter sp.]|nr:alginate export family protein [Usitatibacter sp.]
MFGTGIRMIVALLAAWTALSAGAADDLGDAGLDFDQAMAQGRLFGELRPRYNRIDESDKPLLTEGGTLRLAAGLKSGAWHGTRFTVEAIHATHVGAKHFDDEFRPGNQYPLLPDPDHTGLNQVHAEYASPEGGLRLKLGRQIVHLNNQRWVSDNDFRQIPQLFDGALANVAGFASAELTAGYFYRIRDTSGALEHLRLTILNAAWNPLPAQAFAAYAVFHDQPGSSNTGFADSSYRVVGVRLEGSLRPECPIDMPYLVEVAQQKPYAGGDARIDALYWRVGLGLAGRNWGLRLDQETKGSNDGLYGMQNPLTDFYAFNGWTLRFFTTPRNGLRDRWFTYRVEILPELTLYGEEHRFHSDYGDLDYGRERDIGLFWQALPNLVVRAQHGRYDPPTGGPGISIRKTWITASYAF